MSPGVVAAVVAAGLVVVLAWLMSVAAFLAWAFWPRSPDLAAFDDAVAALETSPGITLDTTSRDGTVSMVARASATGETVGLLTVDGAPSEMLEVGGQSYLRSVDGTFPGGPLAAASGDGDTAALEATLLAGRWVTVDLDTPTIPAQSPPSPGELADRLRSALADPDTVTLLDEPGPQVLGGPTQVALTSAGAVHITATAPHRVVRLDPTRTSDAGSSTTTGSPRRDDHPEFRAVGHAVVGAEASSTGADEGTDIGEGSLTSSGLFGDGPIDITQLSPDEVGELFDDIAANVEQLAEVYDTSFELSFAGKPSLTCGSGGCTVSAVVVAGVLSSRRVVSAEATMTLNAWVSVEGAAAGTCVQFAPLEIDRPTAISCAIPQAGAVFAAADERKKVAALAATPPGGTARWVVNSAGTVVVLSRAALDLTELRAEIDDNRAESLGKASGDGVEEQRLADEAAASARHSDSVTPLGKTGSIAGQDRNTDVRRRVTQRQQGLTPEVRARVEDLARDPDKADKITPGSRLEALDVADLERSGKLPGPVRRIDPAADPAESGADFVDGAGQKWDHKQAYSGPDFDAESWVDKVKKDLDLGENIIVNRDGLNATDLAALERVIQMRGLGDRFIFSPPTTS